MKYIVDRIESGIVVCEDEKKNQVKFSTRLLYEDIKEGDWFELSKGIATFLKDETELARNKNIALQNSLFE